MGLDTYITLQEAMQRLSLNSTLLTTLIDHGRIRGGRLNGTFVLLEEDVRRMAEQKVAKERLRNKVAHLEGHGIGIREASRKYAINDGSISRWVSAGYIRVLVPGYGRGHRTLIDESDVAYAKEVIQVRQAGQGKQVFTDEFMPDWF